MEFLGHMVGNGKMMLPAHRAEVLGKYNKPTTKKGLRAFLDTISFYRRYMELLASQRAVLTPLTAKQAPSKVVWVSGPLITFVQLYLIHVYCVYLSPKTPSHLLQMPQDWALEVYYR